MYNINNITTIYVSQKSGNDYHQGFYPDCNEMLTGPVRTIEKALSMVAEMREFGAQQPVRIKVTDETYYIQKPICIDPAVSNITIEPMKKTLLSGGIMVDWFKPDTFNGNKCVSADLSGFPELEFTDFYVNGRPRRRTRFPQEGFLKPEDVEEHSDELRAGSKWFTVKEKDFCKIKDFCHPEWCIVSFNHYWVDEHSQIEAIEPETRKVVLKHRSCYTIEPTHPASALEYCIENVAEMFENPGEWYYDRQNSKIYYIPEKADAYASEIVGYIPVVSTILRLAGTLENRIKDVTIRNFQIAYTRGERITADGAEVTFASDTQSVCDTAAAIEISYAQGCAIEKCECYCIGLHMIGLRAGSRNIRIDNNILREIGAGGIVVTGGAFGSEAEEHTFGNRIEDNRIIGCGRRYYAACGILLMHTYENVIAHNEIADLNYTGISCGWVWGYENSITRENLIEKNHIHDIGNGVLSDMGGIYLLGKQQGTIVRCNLIHDVYSRHYGGWALYADEGASAVVFEQNICYNTNSNAFHQHYGCGNTVRNNIFCFSKDAPIGMSRPELHLGTIFEQNIIVTHGQRALEIGYKGEETGCLQVISLQRNLFFDVGKGEPAMIQIGNKVYSYDEYRKLGIDMDSVCADPLFADMDAFDFRIAEDSPAIALGFVPIDISDIGVRTKA